MSLWSQILVGAVTDSIGVIATITFHAYRENKKIRLAYLRDQIDKFYGPIYYGIYKYRINKGLTKIATESSFIRHRKEHNNTGIAWRKFVIQAQEDINEYGNFLYEHLSVNLSYADINDLPLLEAGIKAIKVIVHGIEEGKKKSNDPQYEQQHLDSLTHVEQDKQFNNFLEHFSQRFEEKKAELISMQKRKKVSMDEA